MVEQAERVKQDTTSMWDELVAEYGGEECSKGDRQKCETQKERWLMTIDKYHSKLTALKGKVRGIEAELGLEVPPCSNFLKQTQCDLIGDLDMCNGDCAGKPCRDKCPATCGVCASKDEL
jgi:hypothetical protein